MPSLRIPSGTVRLPTPRIFGHNRIRTQERPSSASTSPNSPTSPGRPFDGRLARIVRDRHDPCVARSRRPTWDCITVFVASINSRRPSTTARGSKAPRYLWAQVLRRGTLRARMVRQRHGSAARQHRMRHLGGPSFTASATVLGVAFFHESRGDGDHLSRPRCCRRGTARPPPIRHSTLCG